MDDLDSPMRGLDEPSRYAMREITRDADGHRGTWLVASTGVSGLDDLIASAASMGGECEVIDLDDGERVVWTNERPA